MGKFAAAAIASLLKVKKNVKIAAIFIGVIAVITIICIFSGKGEREQTTHINSTKIAELGCLKVKGQIVCFEKFKYDYVGLNKAVFVYDVDAVLSVNMTERQKNGSELSLPSPRVIMAGINHRDNENVYRKGAEIFLKRFEETAGVRAQEKIKEIADSGEMKTLAKQQAELIIPAIFYPGEKIELKWRDGK